MKKIVFVSLLIFAGLAQAQGGKNIQIACTATVPTVESFILKSVRDLDYNGPVNRQDGNWVLVYKNKPYESNLNLDISVNETRSGILIFTISEVIDGRLKMIRDLEVTRTGHEPVVYSFETKGGYQLFKCRARFI